MTPGSVFRHAPLLLHISTARPKPPQLDQSNPVSNELCFAAWCSYSGENGTTFGHHVLGVDDFIWIENPVRIEHSLDLLE